MSWLRPSSNIYSTKKRKKRGGGKKTKNRKRKQSGGGRTKQTKDKKEFDKMWNKMKKTMRNKSVINFDDKIVEQLIRDVQIVNFDNRPNQPYSKKIMERKINEHYKRIGKYMYNIISKKIDQAPIGGKTLKKKRNNKRKTRKH